MIKVENSVVWGFEHAVRGMRNPLESHDKSDSGYCWDDNCKALCDSCVFNIGFCSGPPVNIETAGYFCIGENDLALMQKLYKAGPEHRKYLRQIFVSMDIVAPLYWWKEFDQYKIGVTTDSCSTMHSIHKKEFTADDFSREHLEGFYRQSLNKTIEWLNGARERYLEGKDKRYWWQMIQLLPSSYNQRRTVTMNYENVFNIINQRRDHKLDEWRDFISELLKLPYVKEIGGFENDG